MAYTKANDPWADAPSTATPITAAALDTIEQGISDTSDAFDAHAADAGLHAGAASGTILAFVEAGTSATYSIATTTDTDVDSTNLACTFTVPPSGNVLVVMEALADSSSGCFPEWLVRESTTTLKTVGMGGASQYARMRASVRITGLTPAASKTYKWGFHRISSGTHNIYTGGGGGTNGNATMHVLALP